MAEATSSTNAETTIQDVETGDRLPVYFGSEMRKVKVEYGPPREVHVHLYRWVRPKWFPLTRSLIFTVLDLVGTQVQYSLARATNCDICTALYLVLLYPIIVLVAIIATPMIMIWELSCFAPEGYDMYERGYYRIDSTSCCLCLHRRCLEKPTKENNRPPARVP